MANIDRTFLDCYSGELYDRDHEFKSLIQERFLPIVKDGTPPAWQNDDLTELWDRAKQDFDRDDDALQLDGDVFYRFLVDLLIGAGATEHPGSIVDDGSPGITSSVSLLFATAPEAVVDRALENLKLMLVRA